MNLPPLPSPCPHRLSLSGSPALSTGLIAGQRAARAHTVTHTRATSWTLLSITPQFYITDLATGGLVCHCVHLQIDNAQTHCNTHTDKQSFSISLQHKHTHTHFPFPLPSVTQHIHSQLPPLLSPPISQTKVSCPGLRLLM